MNFRYTLHMYQDKTFLLLPASERKYYDTSIFGTDIYYTDEMAELCLLQSGDCFHLDGKKLTVKGIYDYFYYFHELALKKLISDPTTIAIKGKTIEDAITQLNKLIKDTDIKTKKFLKSTNGQPLPFFIIEKLFGKGVFETINSLYYSRDRKSFFLPVQKSSKNDIDISKGVLFDIEIIYLAYKLGFSLETIKKNKCKIASLTKGALLNAISEKENSLKSGKEKGLIGIDDGDKATYFKYSNDVKRNTLKELQNLKKFVNSFELAPLTNIDFTKDQTSILAFFNKEKDYPDAEMLKLVWGGETLVSNNMMFYVAKHFGKGQTFDLSLFLSLCSCSISEMVCVIKNMQKTNIQQYLTPDVFDSIMNKISAISDENEKKQAIDAVLELIKGDWNNDWTKEEIKKHKLLVFLASAGERSNFSEKDIIHTTLKRLYDEIIKSYISGLPLI